MSENDKFMDLPVWYLQRTDFDNDGNLINPLLRNKKVLVMLQANYCGYCTQAKPDFQRVAAQIIELAKGNGDPNSVKAKQLVFATIQADGNEPGEKEIMDIMDKIKPDFQGFPDYVYYINGRRRHDAGPNGRDANHLINYVMGI